MGQARSGAWARVPAAAAAALGGGALLTSGPAAAAAGWWSLAALALAGLVALLTAVSFADLAAQSSPASVFAHVRTRLGVLPGRLAGVLACAGWTVAGATVAGAMGAYLWPARPRLAAVALVAAVLVAVLARWRPTPPARWLIFVVTMVTMLVFIVAGLAIDPVAQAVPTDPGVSGADDPTGVLTAAGVLSFGFLNADRVRSPRTAAGTVVAVAAMSGLVLWTALRQLGGPRLALSPTPLRDALAAADGAAIDPLLTLGLLVGALLSIRVLLDRAADEVADLASEGEFPAAAVPHRYLLVAIAMAGIALVADPGWAVQLAATLTLGAFAFVNSAARTLCRTDRSTWIRTGCCGLFLCVVVGVNISLAALATAVAVLGAGAAAGTVRVRRARAATPG